MQDLRLAVAAAAGIDLDLKPRGFNLGLGFDAGEDDGEDDDDDRVRVVGISEGIPPEDRIAYRSRDGAFLFISVWAIVLTMSCFVYYIQIRRMPSFPSASWRTSSWNWTTRADERVWAPGTSGPRSGRCTRHSWTRWDRVRYRASAADR